jgi:hypothetical protein
MTNQGWTVWEAAWGGAGRPDKGHARLTKPTYNKPSNETNMPFRTTSGANARKQSGAPSRLLVAFRCLKSTLCSYFSRCWIWKWNWYLIPWITWYFSLPFMDLHVKSFVPILFCGWYSRYVAWVEEKDSCVQLFVQSDRKHYHCFQKSFYSVYMHITMLRNILTLWMFSKKLIAKDLEKDLHDDENWFAERCLSWRRWREL